MYGLVTEWGHYLGHLLLTKVTQGIKHTAARVRTKGNTMADNTEWS